MPSSTLSLSLDKDLLARLRAAAEDAGESVEAFAARLIANGLSYDEWAISEARVDEYEATGVSESAEAVFEHVRDHLQQRLAERRTPAK